MKGKRVPMVDQVDVNIVDEDITRLLLFEQGGLDFVQLRGRLRRAFSRTASSSPSTPARGITRQVNVEPFLFSLYFNMKDPVVGGMSNERIALRRAIAHGFDTDTLIKVVLADQAIPANQFIPPGRRRTRSRVAGESRSTIRLPRRRSSTASATRSAIPTAFARRRMALGSRSCCRSHRAASRANCRRCSRRTWKRSACARTST
jgi:ABC-type transport system substrate-binding protein